MSTVTFNGTRLNASDAATGWGNNGGGGPSPAAEPQLRYQGSAAVNRKVTSTTARQGVEYDHGSSFDMTGPAFPLFLAKIKVGDAGDLNTVFGCEVLLGSAAGARFGYNVSGSGANNDQYAQGYNSQGGLAEGYIITAINPNVAQWRETTAGSPALGAVDHFACGFQFQTGGAKSENVAMDAIDLGVGLDYTGSAFTFNDGADTDQNVVGNRWGFACRNGSVLSLRGTHRVGAGGVATSGTDSTTCLFPDGYHGTGDAGIEVDLSNAATDITLAGTYRGLGRLYGSDDTRPDLTLVGSAGSFTLTGALRNFRNVLLTSGATISAASVSCASLEQGGGTLTNSEIRCAAAAGIAVCDDFTPGDASNVTWVQDGAGHAIEITAPGTYAFSGQFFEGFGADGANDAAIYNNSGGAVTINVVGGGDTPTVRNGAGASTTVNNTISLTIDGLILGGSLSIFDNEDADPQFLGTLLDSESPIGGTSYVFTHSSPGNEVIVQLVASGYEELNQTLTLAASDQSITLRPQLETNL